MHYLFVYEQRKMNIVCGIRILTLTLLVNLMLLSAGFDDGERACCATGRFEMSYLCNRYNPFTCKVANKYVFWDSFHPSEKTNLIVAQHAIKTSLVAFM